MAVTTAAVVGGAVVASKGAKAAKKAGEAQEEAALSAVGEQRRQFDITQQQFAPFRQAGLGALQQQLALLGLPGLDPQQFGPQPAETPQARQFDQTRGGFQIRKPGRAGAGPSPFIGPPQAQAAAAPGAPFPEAVSREDALAAFAETPGQQFLRERQERALLRSSSAIGGLGGGNVRTALQEQAFGRAATQLGDFQNRLAALSGSAQTATGNVAQLGAQAAGQIGQGLQQAGAARASGILGSQQARAQGFSSIAGGLGSAFSGGFGGGRPAITETTGGPIANAPGGFGFSDIRLKTNIKKVGELDSGLNWYSWIWSDEAKDIVGDQASEGVMAQEVRQIFPEAVVKGQGGYIMVDYGSIH